MTSIAAAKTAKAHGQPVHRPKLVLFYSPRRAIAVGACAVHRQLASDAHSTTLSSSLTRARV